ncbi:MAG: DNA polymerase Y family protein [Bdellovibrionota bacterium]
MSIYNQKYIALIDCDSFFCSCEIKSNPKLKGKALCVTTGERGCIVSRTKEAKKMGIKMGAPVFQAIKEYPNCIYIKANHEKYIEISKKVMQILKDLSPTVEVYSIDEAFMDLTGLLKVYKKNYFDFAKYIQEKILNEANIPVSIGISRSKTLAKIASYKAKTSKERIVLLGKLKIKRFLKDIDVSEVWGIGRKLSTKLKSLGVFTADEFTKKEDWWIKANFGKHGLDTKYELLGQAINLVSDAYTPPKSIMHSQAFLIFTNDLNYIKNELLIHIHITCLKLRYANCKCKKIGVMLKRKDFKCDLLQSNLSYPTNLELDISDIAFNLLNTMYEKNILYRSVGIVLENIVKENNEQLDFFIDIDKKEKRDNLGKTIDKLEEKFGKNIVKIGGILP